MLGVAILLPGMGQVLNRAPVRGLVFVCYMVLLGVITYHLTTPEHSFLGRYAGGLFVYAISIMDAYRTAAVQALTRHPSSSQELGGARRHGDLTL